MQGLNDLLLIGGAERAALKPIEAGAEGETLNFTSADVTIYNNYLAQNGSVKPVAAGDSLSQRDVMELMLIGSANNYARGHYTIGVRHEVINTSATPVTIATRPTNRPVIGLSSRRRRPPSCRS